MGEIWGTQRKPQKPEGTNCPKISCNPKVSSRRTLAGYSLSYDFVQSDLSEANRPDMTVWWWLISQGSQQVNLMLIFLNPLGKRVQVGECSVLRVND